MLFQLDFCTTADFGDDGSVADGGTKSVIIIITGLTSGPLVFKEFSNVARLRGRGAK